jgi:hypothetical protein
MMMEELLLDSLVAVQLVLMRSPQNPLQHVRLMNWLQSFSEMEAFHIANNKT